MKAVDSLAVYNFILGSNADRRRFWWKSLNSLPSTELLFQQPDCITKPFPSDHFPQ